MNKITNRIKSSELWKNNSARAFLIAGALLLAAAVIVTAANVRPQSGRFITGYTPYDRRFGLWWELFQIPVSGLILFAANTYLAAKFMTKDRLLSYIMLASAAFLELLLLIAALNFLINLPQ